MTITETNCKSFLNRMTDGFFAIRYLPFRYTCNPYRGCSHGCVYCYAVRSHYYLKSTPEAFAKDIYVKVNCAEVLDRELHRIARRGKRSVLIIGNISDAYQPIERKYRLTRQILEICLKHRYPCFIETKSPLILEDIDLLERLGGHHLVGVGMTVTSYDDQFTRLMEPGVPRTKLVGSYKCLGHLRMLTLQKLASVGVDTYLHITPYFPLITDRDLEQIVGDAAEANVSAIIMAPLELTNFIRDRVVKRLNNTSYAYLIPQYDNLYLEKGRRLGGRITTSEQEHFKAECQLSELCRRSDVRYWAFTNLQFNSFTRTAGIYRWGYPILLDYYASLRRNGEISLSDAIALANKFSIDDRYLAALRKRWISGDLFKGIYGITRITRDGEVVYAASDKE